MIAFQVEKNGFLLLLCFSQSEFHISILLEATCTFLHIVHVLLPYLVYSTMEVTWFPSCGF